LSKTMAEDVLTLYRSYFDVTITRMFGVYGPYQRGKLVPMIADAVRFNREVFVDRNPLDNQDLDGLRVSLIYIDDLPDAMLALLCTRNCRVVNLAGSEAVSIRRLANVLGASLGVEPTVTVSMRYREGDFVADLETYEKLFGPPKISLEEGVSRFLA